MDGLYVCAESECRLVKKQSFVVLVFLFLTVDILVSGSSVGSDPFPSSRLCALLAGGITYPVLNVEPFLEQESSKYFSMLFLPI